MSGINLGHQQLSCLHVGNPCSLELDHAWWDVSFPLSTRPHQNVVWYNNSWLGFLKILNYVHCTKRKRKIYCKIWALICHSYMLRWLIGIILGEIICESSNWQHIQSLKITILGANWQLFRLERIAKCSYFILSTQNIKFHWIVMKIKRFLLPIWWYNRDLFPLRNKYNVVFVTVSVRYCARSPSPEPPLIWGGEGGGDYKQEL